MYTEKFTRFEKLLVLVLPFSKLLQLLTLVEIFSKIKFQVTSFIVQAYNCYNEMKLI